MTKRERGRDTGGRQRARDGCVSVFLLQVPVLLLLLLCVLNIASSVARTVFADDLYLGVQPIVYYYYYYYCKGATAAVCVRFLFTLCREP